MKVIFLASFLQDVRKQCDARVRRRVAEAIVDVERVASAEAIRSIKRLSGSTEYYRIRIGDWRIGVKIVGDTVTFVRCLHRREVYLPILPLSMPHSRTIVVGDVHGCGGELLDLLARLEFPRGGDRLIFVGDLFDRGPLPQVVLQTLLEHRDRGSRDGYRIESVCGNHDAQLLAYCRGLYGGAPASLSRIQQRSIDLVDRAGLLEDLSLFLEELIKMDTIADERGRWAVVHGGIDPDLGLEQTPTAIKLWIKAQPGQPAWYDQYDGRDGLILCGHQHQQRPLIRLRNGRPTVINVDTGCCYGNALTAYVLEDERFVSVPAKRVYYAERE